MRWNVAPSNLPKTGGADRRIENPSQALIVAVASIIETPVANGGLIVIGHTMKQIVTGDHHAAGGIG